MKLKNIQFVSVDIETTGLSPISSRVIEIGAIKFNPWGLTEEKFDVLIHPEVEVPDEVIQIHGITNEMLENCVTIDKVLPDFVNFLGECPVIAHNSGFDFSFLSQDARELGLNFNNHVFDTLKLSRLAFPDNRHSLDALIDYFGLSFEGKRHRGLADAIYCAKVFELALDKLHLETYEDLVKITPPKLPFEFISKKSRIFSRYSNIIRNAITNRKALEIEYYSRKNSQVCMQVIPYRVLDNLTFEVSVIKTKKRRFLKIPRIVDLHALN